MLPTLALVGRPNVGKSTLFNCLTRSRDALVAEIPGLTRDRKYGQAIFDDKSFIVIDTGGLSGDQQDLDLLMAGQVWQAVEEADVVVFLVDAKQGVFPVEADIAERLRLTGKPVTLVVNKVDGMDSELAKLDFYALGIAQVHAISASHQRGVPALTEHLVSQFPAREQDAALLDQENHGLRIAILGRPNVGKSTLVNRILGEERVLAYDQPGTTRDSISIPFERDGRGFVLVDTAGIRRRHKVQDKIEKFSVIKALQAIEAANVVIMVLDAQEGITDQDSHLIGYIQDAGRGLLIAVNKWDGLSDYQRRRVKDTLDRKLGFINFAPMRFISALHGTGVGKLLPELLLIQDSATRDLPASELTKVLEDAVAAHPPHLVHGRRIKLRYAHQGGKNPPLIIIHGNQTEHVSPDYRRYLINYFRKVFQLDGTPIRLAFRSGENPFKDKPNKLNSRQIAKKQRLRKFVARGK